MYNPKMIFNITLFLISVLLLFPAADALADYTPVRDSSVLKISQHVWNNEFDQAIALADSLIIREPDNPLGQFLKGTILQTISEEFRTDIYNKEIDNLLSNAIDMADDLSDDDKSNPDWKFIGGASYGYRGLHRSFHGKWFKAFRDGLKCNSRLKDAIALDSTFFDAYLGLGAYAYYKTVMAGNFLWLPFVSDRREEGMAMVKLAADSGFLATYNARESFLRIYLTEKRFDDLTALADSLDKLRPNDPYCLLYYAYGLARTGQFDLAREKVNLLRKKWKESPWFDEFAILEAELALATACYVDGDIDSARIIIDKILSNKKFKKKNPYFEETYNRAKDLKEEIE